MKYRNCGFSMTAVNMCWEGRRTRKTIEAPYRVFGDLALNVRPIFLLIQNDAFSLLQSIIRTRHFSYADAYLEIFYEGLTSC